MHENKNAHSKNDLSQLGNKTEIPIGYKDETAFLKSLASTAKNPGKTSQKGTATVLAIYSSDWEY